MNSPPITLRFCSGSVTPASASQKALAGIDRDDAQAKPLAHGLLHFGKLILAQHAVVDEDAG